jgi:hypothetical protein
MRTSGIIPHDEKPDFTFQGASVWRMPTVKGEYPYEYVMCKHLADGREAVASFISRYEPTEAVFAKAYQSLLHAPHFKHD